MKSIQYLAGLLLALTLAACGGGGGSAGTSSAGAASSTSASATGSNTTGTSQVTASGSISIDVISAGVSTTSITALEIAQAKITLKDAAGAPVSGVVVTFAESGASLLNIAPASKTALTDLLGQASVDINAATTNSTGGTQIGATATISGVTVNASKGIQISNAPPTGPQVSPQLLATAINFLSVDPANQSIVLAGSGGGGRVESATLKFRVVDKNNTPVNGASVTFAAVPASAVTLNIPTAVSASDGVVTTTVSSKSVASAVVVKATVDTTAITTQSDTLLVTTGVATAAGFDLSASKYNLNSGISGDSSDITVRIVDANGSPVADGVPVVFTANYGAVGTSARSGCVTAGGACVVPYKVQNPRPADGTLARVTAATQVGTSTSVTGFLDFIFSQPSLLDLYTASSGGSTVTSFTGIATCKISGFAYVGTPAGFPAPAGTTVSVIPLGSDVSATVKTGSPILDLATARTPVSFTFDVSATALAPPCNAAGGGVASTIVEVKFTAGTILQSRFVSVNYPI